MNCIIDNIGIWDFIMFRVLKWGVGGAVFGMFGLPLLLLLLGMLSSVATYGAGGLISGISILYYGMLFLVCGLMCGGFVGGMIGADPNPYRRKALLYYLLRIFGGICVLLVAGIVLFVLIKP